MLQSKELARCACHSSHTCNNPILSITGVSQDANKPKVKIMHHGNFLPSFLSKGYRTGLPWFEIWDSTTLQRDMVGTGFIQSLWIFSGRACLNWGQTEIWHNNHALIYQARDVSSWRTMHMSTNYQINIRDPIAIYIETRIDLYIAYQRNHPT